jgi:hypothetical protein
MNIWCDFANCSAMPEGDYLVLRKRRWPFAPWDVYRWSAGSCDRYAGGFFTRRAAKRWAEKKAQ